MNGVERRRVRVVLALAAVAVVTVATAALGAESRVQVEEGAEAVDEAALTDVVRQAESDGLVLSVSVLASEPSGGAEAAADALVDQHGGAALVITPEEIGGVSDDHGSAQVDVAVDQALDELLDRDDVVAAAATFAERLEGAESGDAPTAAAGGVFGGGSGLPIPLPFLVIGGIVLLLSIVGRGRRRRRRRGYADHAYGPGSRRRRTTRTRVGAARGASRGTSSRSRGSTSRSRSSGRSRSRSSSRGRSSKRR